MIVFAGTLPPPVHGMANVNLQMVRLLEERDRVVVYAVGPGRRTGVTGHLVKALRALAAVAGIVAARVRGARVFYGSVDDGLGGAYTCAFALTGRLMGMSLYLHHHSFRHLNASRRIMRIVTACAGKAARHVVLCECMGDLLKTRYRAVKHVIPVPNTTPMKDRSSAHLAAPRERSLTLGMLSNLFPEKGYDRFFELLEKLRNAGIEARAILAGPAFRPGVEAEIAEALGRNGSALEWRGQLDETGKEQFFRDIDVFVFPTRYETEAYPLVLLEALVSGVPIIAAQRGCIADITAGISGCAAIPGDLDFVEAAMPQLEAWARDRTLIVQAAAEAAQKGRALVERNLRQREALVDEIVRASAVND